MSCLQNCYSILNLVEHDLDLQIMIDRGWISVMIGRFQSRPHKWPSRSGRFKLLFLKIKYAGGRAARNRTALRSIANGNCREAEPKWNDLTIRASNQQIHPSHFRGGSNHEQIRCSHPDRRIHLYYWSRNSYSLGFRSHRRTRNRTRRTQLNWTDHGDGLCFGHHRLNGRSAHRGETTDLGDSE